MKKSKMTAWYPGNVKPVRAGIYETKSPFFNGEPGWFAHWDGERWGPAYMKMAPAMMERRRANVFQDRQWRGLRTPAK